MSEGPRSAADPNVHWPHHLVVKGFNVRDNGESIRCAIYLFMEKIFGNNMPSPLMYGYHDPIVGGQNDNNRVLRVSFCKAEGVSISLDEALSRFCQRFFELKDDTIAYSLSNFGRLGFSVEEPKMKVQWYTALFRHMHAYTENDFAVLNSKINRIRDHNLRSWFPPWQGAVLLAVSIGATALWEANKQPRFMTLKDTNSLKPRPVSTSIVGAADLLLRSIAARKEKENDIEGTTRSAKIKCEDFVAKIDAVVSLIKTTPNGASSPATHVEVNLKIVDLFEVGADAVTVCEKAVECFMNIRSRNLELALVSASNTGINAFNVARSLNQASQIRSLPVPDIQVQDKFMNKAKHLLGIIDTTPGQAAAAAERELYETTRASAIRDAHIDGALSGLQALYTGYQVVQGVRSAYNAYASQKKWTSVANMIYVGISYGQKCELFIRWTYHSADGARGLSQEQLRELEEQTRERNSRIPTDAELAPAAIQARLVQYSATLDTVKKELQGSL